jgi:hypothetical protein
VFVEHTLPSAHTAAAVVPAGQYWPDAQATCAAGVAHTEPSAQVAATEAPAGQYCPLRHATGALAPPAHVEPAVHGA